MNVFLKIATVRFLIGNYIEYMYEFFNLISIGMIKRIQILTLTEPSKIL